MKHSSDFEEEARKFLLQICKLIKKEPADLPHLLDPMVVKIAASTLNVSYQQGANDTYSKIL